MKVILELSGPVVIQSKCTMSYISHKTLATGLPVAKNLIEYNSNSFRKMMKKRRNNSYWAYWGKSDSYNDENAIDFRWSGVHEDEEDTALANFIENLQKQTDEKIFTKK